MLNRLTPSGRLWLVTVIAFILVLVIFPRDTRPVIPFKHSPLAGQVIAYYTNDYQRYAIEELTKDGRLQHLEVGTNDSCVTQTIENT